MVTTLIARPEIKGGQSSPSGGILNLNLLTIEDYRGDSSLRHDNSPTLPSINLGTHLPKHGAGTPLDGNERILYGRFNLPAGTSREGMGLFKHGTDSQVIPTQVIPRTDFSGRAKTDDKDLRPVNRQYLHVDINSLTRTVPGPVAVTHLGSVRRFDIIQGGTSMINTGAFTIRDMRVGEIREGSSEERFLDTRAGKTAFTIFWGTTGAGFIASAASLVMAGLPIIGLPLAAAWGLAALLCWNRDGCLHPSTLVSDGSQEIPIEAALPGQELIGHDGRGHRVISVDRTRYCGRFIEFATGEPSASVRLTPDHPVPALRNSDLVMIRAEALKVGDLLVGSGKVLDGGSELCLNQIIQIGETKPLSEAVYSVTLEGSGFVQTSNVLVAGGCTK